MIVLALDIATNVGWAAGDGAPQGTRYGTVGFGLATDDFGRLSASFSNWLADTITEHEPDLIAIERGFFRGPMSYHLSGMIWDANRVAWLRNVPRVEYTPASIKKFVTGDGRADKKRVIACVEELHFDPQSDHEADALALLLLALDRVKERAAA